MERQNDTEPTMRGTIFHQADISAGAGRIDLGKSGAKECGLQRYYRMKNAELIAVLRSTPNAASRDYKPMPALLVGINPKPRSVARPPKPTRLPPLPSERFFNPYELERDFEGAYRSFRFNGPEKMDVDTFLKETRGSIASLIRLRQTISMKTLLMMLRQDLTQAATAAAVLFT